ncbi:MAG: hypothetical protein IJ870_00440 [Alphaproteobacteria bacterium]|nr:hypothetical protein [Alphaproteobacteria bacterium]
MTAFDFNETLDRYMMPQEILSPLIFDADDKMHENVRQNLLKIVGKIIYLTITDIKGLEIEDICLVGSLSGFLYREKSDIDIYVTVKNTSCKELTKDKQHLGIFTSAQTNALKLRNARFHYQDKLVDVKMSPYLPMYASIYSIKENTWLVKPNKDEFKHIKKEDVINEYLLKKKIILNQLEDFEKKYTGFELADKLHFFYLQTMNQFVTHKNKLSDHIVYKLLGKEGIFNLISGAAMKAYMINCSFQKDNAL